jgi:hypothetical protein
MAGKSTPKKRKKYVPRSARKMQIYNLLLTAHRPVTRGEILRHLKMKHSKWTHALFQEMVDEKYLLPPVERRQGNRVMLVYQANDLGKDFNNV